MDWKIRNKKKYNIIYADIIANSILVCKLIGTFLLGSSVIKYIAYVYNKDLKEVADMIIPYIEKHEPSQWKELSKDTKWHLSL